MPARFRIKRQRPFNAADLYPWKLRDASRPAFLGQYASHALAIAAIDAKLSIESGIPTRRAIREAMHRGLAAMSARS